jgi:hypothetical protein
LIPKSRASEVARSTSWESEVGNAENSCEACVASTGKSRYPAAQRRATPKRKIRATETGLGTLRRCRASTGAESATARSSPVASKSIVVATVARKR